MRIKRQGVWEPDVAGRHFRVSTVFGRLRRRNGPPLEAWRDCPTDVSLNRTEGLSTFATSVSIMNAFESSQDGTPGANPRPCPPIPDTGNREELAQDAARLHREGSAELADGNLAAAREKFRAAVDRRQALGDRGREAAAWYQLASIASREGDSRAAGEGFRRTLELAHAVGDRDVEAAALHQVGVIAWKKGKRSTGLLLVAVGFGLLPSQASGDEEKAMTYLAHMAASMGYGLDKLQTLLSEAVAEYDHDGGRSLVDEALSDAPESAGSVFECV